MTLNPGQTFLSRRRASKEKGELKKKKLQPKQKTEEKGPPLVMEGYFGAVIVRPGKFISVASHFG